MKQLQSSDKNIQALLNNKTLPEIQVKYLCAKAKEILLQEENIVKVRSPVTVCGDIHGQFHDLLQIFKIGGVPPDTNYLFLGDYVDRGIQSVQSFLLLISLKIKYKSRITLLRGNHESRQITQVYGLYDESLKKYGNCNVWMYFTEVFDLLPLAALVENQLFCMHGGLSPSIQNLNQFNTLDRKSEIPSEGPICDLLWSDPDQKQGWGPSPRGAGYIFGPNVSKDFNYYNNTKLIIRAHQLTITGVEYTHQKNLVTVFSAPNYCYRCGNPGGMLQINEKMKINSINFDHSPNNVLDRTEIKRVPDYFL